MTMIITEPRQHWSVLYLLMTYPWWDPMCIIPTQRRDFLLVEEGWVQIVKKSCELRKFSLVSVDNKILLIVENCMYSIVRFISKVRVRLDEVQNCQQGLAMNCNNPLSLKILISNTHRTTFTGKPDYNEDEIELSKYGCWNPEFARMNLPSFRAAYLFLARVPRNVPFCFL